MDPKSAGQLGTRARWTIMIVSLGVTASSFLFINGVAFLIPSLEARRGVSLTEAGLLSSMPSWGMVVTLILWGYVLDRVGERIVMTAGSALTAAAAYAAASVHSLVWVAVYLFLVAWPRRAATPPAAGWCPAGFRRSSAAWQWVSARPRNRWESRWARWRYPSWLTTVPARG